jgi:hypothetical protein
VKGRDKGHAELSQGDCAGQTVLCVDQIEPACAELAPELERCSRTSWTNCCGQQTRAP